MPSILFKLPLELISRVAFELENRDIKQLRLTCSTARIFFLLRLSRVFLSSNLRDIKVFRQISQHEIFRHQVRELVWDHTYFVDHLGSEFSGELVDVSELVDIDPELTSHQVFQIRCQAEMAKTSARGKRFEETDAYSSMLESTYQHRDSRAYGGRTVLKDLQLYERMLEEQEDIRESAEDLKALSEGILCFPGLRRITISHATHGWLTQPFYETPTIRELPLGFRYPISRCDGMSAGMGEPRWMQLNQEHSKHFRGYVGIFKELAKAKDRLLIEEMVVETNGLPFGLTSHLFDSKTPEYLDFVDLLRRPGFRRLDLALAHQNQLYIDPHVYRQGHLRDALSEAVDLEHFSFSTNLPEPKRDEIAESLCVPLQQILPVSCWVHLRHFGLFNFFVKNDDLVSFIGCLPDTIRSVELGFLKFVPGNGDYAHLLENVRDTLDWNKRYISERPRLAIALPISRVAPKGMANWIEKEIHTFLYAGGLNPFRGSKGPMGVDFGIGMERDAYNPGYEWPHDDFDWEATAENLRQHMHQLDMQLSQAAYWLTMGIDEGASFAFFIRELMARRNVDIMDGESFYDVMNDITSVWESG